MKILRTISCLLVLIFSALMISDYGLAADQLENITINKSASQEMTELKFTIGSKDYFVGNSKKTMNTVPLSRDARTLVPIRYVVEAIGGSIEWFPDTQETSMTVKSTNIIMKVGESTASVNGIVKAIDSSNTKVVPINAYGRVFVPIRFVMESCNAEIVWNYYKRIVTIRCPRPDLLTLDHSRFSIKYPSNWTIKSDTESALFTSPEGNSINVVYENMETSMTVDQYYEKNVSEIKDLLDNETMVEQSTAIFANGEGRMITFTAKLDNTDLKFSQVFAVKDKTGYVLTYSGDPGMYFNYASVFDRIIPTFTTK